MFLIYAPIAKEQSQLPKNNHGILHVFFSIPGIIMSPNT